ncbi:hypothetical protein HYZ82_01970 [Candidatus Nomurabacteria bacterium]|nr:hypothetical protein [Candidatus Nomurabacteria bacterium]
MPKESTPNNPDPRKDPYKFIEKIEVKEGIPIREVRYIHIDNSSVWREALEKILGSKLGMEHKLGEASSIDSAVSLIKNIAAKREKLDLIIIEEGILTEDEIPGKFYGASPTIEFVKQFELLAAAESMKKFLERTKIVVFGPKAYPSSIAAFDELQKKFPRVIAFVAKMPDLEEIASHFLKALEDAKVVEKKKKA